MENNIQTTKTTLIGTSSKLYNMIIKCVILILLFQKFHFHWQPFFPAVHLFLQAQKSRALL